MVWVKLPKLYKLHTNLLTVYRSSLCTAHLSIVDSAFDQSHIDREIAYNIPCTGKALA